MLRRDNGLLRAGSDGRLGSRLVPVGLHITVGLGKIVLDVDGVSGSLRDGQTEVERNDRGNTTDTDDSSPGLVDRFEVGNRVADDRVLESGERDDGDNARGDCCQGENKIVKLDLRLPHPWAEKTAVIIRPRIRRAANSEVITAETG